MKAKSLPVKTNTFDVFHVPHIFEYLKDPIRAAKENLFVLKPEGLFFMEMHNQIIGSKVT